MTKQIFLEELRKYLTGSMEYREVAGHLGYYGDYIDGQLRSGKSEAQVMEELGDPRLIAKTLTGMEEGGPSGEYREEFVEEEPKSRVNLNLGGRAFTLPGWLFTCLSCLLLFCVLTLIFTLISWLLPYLLILAAGIMVYRFFRNIL